MPSQARTDTKAFTSARSTCSAYGPRWGSRLSTGRDTCFVNIVWPH
jgi:hypothetical protein